MIAFLAGDEVLEDGGRECEVIDPTLSLLSSRGLHIVDPKRISNHCMDPLLWTPVGDQSI